MSDGELGVGERRDERKAGRDDERDDERERASLRMSFSNRVTSCSTSVDGVLTPATKGVEAAVPEGAATSIILSAISASLSRLVESGDEARTILTL